MQFTPWQPVAASPGASRGCCSRRQTTSARLDCPHGWFTGGTQVRSALCPTLHAWTALLADISPKLAIWLAGNMAVVLVAMGLYGCAYLGWAAALSDDSAVVIKARDLHPKLAIGMTVFFALGRLAA